MRSLIIVIIFLFSSISFAKDFGEKKKVGCDPTPEQKCHMTGGKWKNGMCIKTRWRTRWRKRKHSPIPKVNNELRCWRRGGEWKDEMCYIKEKVILPPPASPPSVNESQTVVQVRQEVKSEPKPTPPPQVFVVEQKKESKPEPKPAPKKESWWWLGADAVAWGIYLGDEESISFGLRAKLTFAINYRFRVSGTLGYSFWQNDGLMLGAGMDIRIYKFLFIFSHFDTIWGDFDGVQVGHRYLLANIGLSFWLLEDHLNISLGFIYGAKKHVTRCETPEVFVGGNMLTIGGYF